MEGAGLKASRMSACLLLGHLFAVPSLEWWLLTAALVFSGRICAKFVAFDVLNSLENCDWFVLKAIIIYYNSAFFSFSFLPS